MLWDFKLDLITVHLDGQVIQDYSRQDCVHVVVHAAFSEETQRKMKDVIRFCWHCFFVNYSALVNFSLLEYSKINDALSQEQLLGEVLHFQFWVILVFSQLLLPIVSAAIDQCWIFCSEIRGVVLQLLEPLDDPSHRFFEVFVLVELVDEFFVVHYLVLSGIIVKINVKIRLTTTGLVGILFLLHIYFKCVKSANFWD